MTPLGVGTGSLGLPGDSIPADRFVKAAYLNANYPVVTGEKANVAKFFNILKCNRIILILLKKKALTGIIKGD
ncbi:hypothetical protein GCM10008918_22110 [Lactobacillus kefiranofaciens subsp. kefiranofaciens]|uniref:Linear amide C-N hydrolases, choloylglycine hydrolase family n=1 Tax=Lactobacillus kefiranofaciens TaxID=267818 RepID=A0ABY0MEJ3_9LACO|nr:hypothetical protein FC93_GL001947 [Lactobacillus kefiranofaciens subsp. kefiranofaciens DSM 5016 = JCM 6985]SDA49440.1 Linear amide C-N hydrolases, choloylglycine hydrolase family [Lactobacillus kefiranofaciens]